MECPYCQCRSLNVISADRYLCIECEAVLDEDDAFSDYEGISNGAFVAILFGVMAAILIIKLIV